MLSSIFKLSAYGYLLDTVFDAIINKSPGKLMKIFDGVKGAFTKGKSIWDEWGLSEKISNMIPDAEPEAAPL